MTDTATNVVQGAPTEAPADPSSLRKTVTRVSNVNKRLTKENRALRRIVLAQAIKDLDLDPAEAVDLLDHYAPTYSDDFERSFASDAIHSWIATRRLP